MKRDNSQRLFGMAMGRLNIPAAETRDFAVMPHLHCAELPLDAWLGDKHYVSFYQDETHYRNLYCGSVMDPQVCRAILSAPEKHIRDFVSETKSVLGKLSAAGVNYISLDFDLEEIAGNGDAEEKLLFVLRLLAPVLYRNKQILLLPCRLPSCHEPGVILRLMRNTLSPWIKLRLELHPYDFKKEDDQKKLALSFVFEAGSVVFVYDADSGCRIQKDHVDLWLHTLEQYGYVGPFLLAPLSRRQMSLPESESWDKIAEGYLSNTLL
jgi:hypothetical protein